MIDDFNRGCSNCKHFGKTILEAPCNNCSDIFGDGYNSRWEHDPAMKNNDKSFYISTSRCETFKEIEHRMNEQLLEIYHSSFYPNIEKISAEFMANFNKKENKDMKKQQKKRDRNIINIKDLETKRIKEIMFNGPATIIKWDPTWIQISNDISADKTVTVCKEPDKFDKTTGFLLAVLKELLDNQSYGNILKKIDEINKEN